MWRWGMEMGNFCDLIENLTQLFTEAIHLAPISFTFVSRTDCRLRLSRVIYKFNYSLLMNREWSINQMVNQDTYWTLLIAIVCIPLAEIATWKSNWWRHFCIINCECREWNNWLNSLLGTFTSSNYKKFKLPASNCSRNVFCVSGVVQRKSDFRSTSSRH